MPKIHLHCWFWSLESRQIRKQYIQILVYVLTCEHSSKVLAKLSSRYKNSLKNIKNTSLHHFLFYWSKFGGGLLTIWLKFWNKTSLLTYKLDVQQKRLENTENCIFLLKKTLDYSHTCYTKLPKRGNAYRNLQQNRLTWENVSNPKTNWFLILFTLMHKFKIMYFFAFSQIQLN